MRIQGGQQDVFESPAQVVLKDLEFSNGTIEFDVELTHYPFAVIYFRRENDQHTDVFAGENELLVGVANSFFGWAIMARLDNVAGITAD